MADTQKPTDEPEDYIDYLDAFQKDMYYAIEKNRLAELEELFKNATPTNKYSYFDWDTHPGPVANVHFKIAARKGYFEILEYIIKTSNTYGGCNINGEVCDDAAACGHLNCLRLAHEIGNAPIDIETCFNAAEYGHEDCLRYALKKLYEYDYYNVENQKILCAKAAKNGHIKCLMLLRTIYQGGNPYKEMCWDNRTCKYAAEYGHLNCLEYAYKNGCMYPKEIQPIIVTKILIPKIIIPKWCAAVKNRSFSSIE